jgi:cold shock CspA family protein
MYYNPVFSGSVVAWHGRYGYIESDFDKKQHFVHFRDLQVEGDGYKALAVGQRVEFLVVAEGGRTHAAHVCAPGGRFLPPGAPAGAAGGYASITYPSGGYTPAGYAPTGYLSAGFAPGGFGGFGQGQGTRRDRSHGYPKGLDQPRRLIAATSGTVVSWQGRFGFIESDGDRKQHFVHFRDLQVEGDGYKAVAVGQRVDFQVVEQGGRTHAENVFAQGGAPLPVLLPGSS